MQSVTSGEEPHDQGTRGWDVQGPLHPSTKGPSPGSALPPNGGPKLYRDPDPLESEARRRVGQANHHQRGGSLGSWVAPEVKVPWEGAAQA